MLAVYKKELRQYFHSMTGFAFLAFFLAVIGLYTWAYNLSGGLGNFEVTLGNISFLLVLLIPILTMRIIAEENHQKTNQLLYTAPISITKIVLAKYFALLTLFLIGIAVISLYPLIFCIYGSDVRLAMAYSSIIGFFLLGAAGMAVGLFLSSLTESQAIAAVTSFVVLLLAFLMDGISGMLPTDALTQCILFTLLWLAAVAAFHRLVQSTRLFFLCTAVGAAALWAVYFFKSSVYEGLFNKGLHALALAERFGDFSLGVLHYDAVVYYLSVILLFLFLTIQGIRSRQMRAGVYRSLLIVLVAGSVVLFNGIVSRLELSADLSAGSLFTLSSDTRNVIRGMKDRVTIYYMVQEGEEESYIDNILRQYGKVSDRLSVEKVDPVVHPGFAAKKGIEDTVAQNDVIVVNEATGAAKYIAAQKMLYSEEDYATESYIDYLDVEGQVTSALQRVASGDRRKVYVLARHSGMALGSSLTDALDKMNLEVEELELAKQESVPEDCAVLLLHGLRSDVTEEEKERVLDYLGAGGKALVTLDYTTEAMPNLDEILQTYGVAVVRGVIFEGAGNYAGYINNIVPEVSQDAELLAGLGGYILFPNAAGLVRQEGTLGRGGVTITDLLASSDHSFVKADPSSGEVDQEDGDIDGPFAVGLSVSEPQKDGGETELIVYSSASAFSEELTATSQLENASVFKQSVGALAAEEKLVSVDRKEMSFSYLSVPPMLQMFWAAVIVLLVPGGLLAVGAVIWLLRRKK